MALRLESVDFTLGGQPLIQRPVRFIACTVSAVKSVVSVDLQSLGKIKVGADAAHIVEPVEGI